MALMLSWLRRALPRAGVPAPTVASGRAQLHMRPRVLSAATRMQGHACSLNMQVARQISTSRIAEGGRYTTHVRERAKHWRKHMSKAARKRFRARQERMTEVAASTGGSSGVSRALGRVGAGGSVGSALATVRRPAQLAAGAQSPLALTSARDTPQLPSREQQRRDRTIIESLAMRRLNPLSTREALQAVDADALLRAIDAHTRAASRGHTTTSLPQSQLITAMRVCGAQGRFEDAVRLLERLSERHEPPPGAYLALLSAAGQQRNLPAAERVFHALEEAHPEAMKASSAAPASAARGVGGKRPRGAAPETSKAVTTTVHVAYGALLQAAVRAHELERGFELLVRAESHLPALTPPLFTTLIVGCIHAGQYDRAFELYHHMRTYHCEPDAVTYTSIIAACAKMDAPERALSTLTEMRHAGCEPTHVTYNAVMHACARSFRRFTEAHELFRQMVAAGHAHDVYSYNAVILACSHIGDVKRAREYMAEMFREAVKPNVATLNTLLAVYARSLAPNQSAFKALGDTALAQRSEGAHLLKPPEDPTPAQRVLGSHGRLIDGDVNVLVDNLLGDYFADGPNAAPTPEEDKIMNTSRDDDDAGLLPKLEEVNQDMQSPQLKVTASYLMREGVVSKELMQELEALNAQYPALDSDGERKEDQQIGREQRKLRDDAVQSRAAIEQQADELAAKEARLRSLAGQAARALQSPASAQEPVVFTEILQRFARETATTDIVKAPESVSLEQYLRQLERDIDATLTGKAGDAAAGGEPEKDQLTIGGRTLGELLSVDDVPAPPLSDEDGDADPIAMHDHYARALAARISSAINDEVDSALQPLLEDDGEGTKPMLPEETGPEGAVQPSSLATGAQYDTRDATGSQGDASASAASPAVADGEPPFPGAVRRRRSGALRTAAVAASSLPATAATAPMDSTPPPEHEPVSVAPFSVVPQVQPADALADTAATPAAASQVLQPVDAIAQTSKSPLPEPVRPWPRRGSRDYQRIIQNAIASVRGFDADLEASESATLSLFRRRVLAQAVKLQYVHPVDAALIHSAESPEKLAKRRFEKLRPTFMDVLVAAQGAPSTSSAATGVDHARSVDSSSSRLTALQGMAAGLLSGAKWLPLDRPEPADQRIARASTVAEARRIYDQEFDPDTLPRDHITLNTMLLVYCNSGRVSAAEEFLATEFTRHDVPPDARTYRALMRMYVRAHNLDGALSVVARADASGVKLDAVCFGALVHAHARAWRLKDAIAVLDRMKHEGLKCPEPFAFLLRQRCTSLGISHASVPAHTHAWQHTPQVRKKRAADSPAVRKGAKRLRMKLPNGWTA